MGMGGMGSDGPGRYRSVSEINVTPLVDIMLVLLIIFMVTAPLMNEGVEVNLPKASSDPLISDKEPLVVSVTADGRIHIENHVVTVNELAAKINAIRQANPELTVYVRGDKTANYGVVMAAMDQLKQIGVTRVGLVTQSGK